MVVASVITGHLTVGAGAVGETTEDEFWDYDRQVDLEGFSSRRVYDTLARQSRNVTQTLAKQKDEVLVFFYILMVYKSYFSCLLTFFCVFDRVEENRIIFSIWKLC